MCKVHQKALSAAAAVEGEIEKLSQNEGTSMVRGEIEEPGSPEV